MKRLISSINHFLAEFSGWLLILLMLILNIDFIQRSFFKPLHGIIELSIFILVTVIYFGLANCEENHAHIKVEMFTLNLPKCFANLVNSITYVIAIFTVFICTWTSGLNAVNSFISNEKVSGIRPIVLYPVKFTVFVGFFLYLLQLIVNFIDQFKKVKE